VLLREVKLIVSVTEGAYFATTTQATNKRNVDVISESTDGLAFLPLLSKFAAKEVIDLCILQSVAE
jgi:hypothetical protein